MAETKSIKEYINEIIPESDRFILRMYKLYNFISEDLFDFTFSEYVCWYVLAKENEPIGPYISKLRKQNGN